MADAIAISKIANWPRTASPPVTHAVLRFASEDFLVEERLDFPFAGTGEHVWLRIRLLVTDGEPADIDVRDPQYLRHDTKKAVEELATRGVRTFCLTLDPKADDYVSRIFGSKGYMVVDRVDRLPERLPLLYAGLTR